MTQAALDVKFERFSKYDVFIFGKRQAHKLSTKGLGVSVLMSP